MEDLKLAFIQRTVNEYMQEVKARMELLMQQMKVNDTGEGAASISYRTTASGAGAEASLSFKEYLRMVDMGAGKGHPLGGLKAVHVELITRRGGNKLVKDNTFKSRKFYSKTAYGKLTPMYNRLLYGFTEETIAQLRQELQQGNATNPTIQ